MIPTAIETFHSLDFVARARGFTNIEITQRDIEKALARAERLATQPLDEPAALFFVLAREPGTLLDAWPVFPCLMARNHAAAVGLRLSATNDELEELARDVCLEGLTFGQVQDWFRGH